MKQLQRAGAVTPPSPLVPRRQGVEPAAGVPDAGLNLLASRTHGLAETGPLAAPPLLWPRDPQAEAWLVTRPVRELTSGCLSYRTDGDWLHGTAHVDERALEGGLEAAAFEAYSALFALLADSGCPHLLRLWNYVSDINGTVDGMERYRQFNAGRQRAFLAADRSAFAGAPAACALGTRQGGLTVHFLAGRIAPLAVENPRQVSAYHYPSSYGPRSPTFSRAALAELGGGREVLFISGTASIVGHQTVHVGDVRRQTEETLVNLQAVIDAARPQSEAADGYTLNELEMTVYVRHEADLSAVRDVLARQLGADAPAVRHALYLRADICRADLLVEIEAQSIGRLKETT